MKALVYGGPGKIEMKDVAVPKIAFQLPCDSAAIAMIIDTNSRVNLIFI